MATILVVEDEFGIAEVLASVLTDAGHTVVTAINGRQGLERLKEIHPQLVLLDFMMPVLDGPAMLRVMRSNPEAHAIPSHYYEFLARAYRRRSGERNVFWLYTQAIQAADGHRDG